MKWTGLAACLEEMRNTHRLLTGTPDENTPLGRTRRRWKDNIKRDIKELGKEDVD
jgi:hypothetical protein